MSATTAFSPAPSRAAVAKKAVIHRMVMPHHTCPYGLKAKDLLERSGYEVEDHHLTTREQTDAFKAEHGVATTPQVFIGGERIGGYDDLRRFLGKHVADPKATSYRPVIALFTMTALMAMAAKLRDMGFERGDVARLGTRRTQVGTGIRRRWPAHRPASSERGRGQATPTGPPHETDDACACSIGRRRELPVAPRPPPRSRRAGDPRRLDP